MLADGGSFVQITNIGGAIRYISVVSFSCYSKLDPFTFFELTFLANFQPRTRKIAGHIFSQAEFQQTFPTKHIRNKLEATEQGNHQTQNIKVVIHEPANIL